MSHIEASIPRKSSPRQAKIRNPAEASAPILGFSRRYTSQFCPKPRMVKPESSRILTQYLYKDDNLRPPPQQLKSAL